MRELQKGEVEVVVLQDCTINGPDHRTLGPLQAGDRVLTADGPYAASLVEDGFVAYASDFPPEALDGAIDEIKALDAELRAAEEDQDGEKSVAVNESHMFPEASSAPRNRGGRSAKAK